jgi:methylenetetrahydrofolate dehydrogenase (NAD+)
MAQQAAASTSFGRSVTGVEVAKTFAAELKQGSEAASARLGRPPKLVGFLASDDEPSAQYATWTEKSCREVGIDFELRRIDIASGKQGAVSGTGVGEVEERVLEANLDNAVDGIMVRFVLP